MGAISLHSAKLFLLAVLLQGAAALDLDTIAKSKDVYLVEFYHPMCATCTEFTPIFKSLAKSLGGKMKTEAVSIEDKAGEKMAVDCGALDEGVPILKLFHKSGDKKGVTVMVNEDPLPKAKE